MINCLVFFQSCRSKMSCGFFFQSFPSAFFGGIKVLFDCSKSPAFKTIKRFSNTSQYSDYLDTNQITLVISFVNMLIRISYQALKAFIWNDIFQKRCRKSQFRAYLIVTRHLMVIFYVPAVPDIICYGRGKGKFSLAALKLP